MPGDLEIVGVVTVGHAGARADGRRLAAEVRRGSRSRTSSAGNAGRRRSPPPGSATRSTSTAVLACGENGWLRYLASQATRIDRARRGGGRVPRGAGLRDPVHLRAPAHRAPGRPRRARRSSTASSPSSGSRTTCCSGTSSRHIHTSPIARIRIGGRRAPRWRLPPPFSKVSRAAAASSRSAGSPQQVTGAPYVARTPSHGGAGGVPAAGLACSATISAPARRLCAAFSVCRRP